VIYNDSSIRESAAKALGEIADYMVVVIRGGLIKYVNPAVRRILGYTEYQILNKQFTEFVAPEYEELVLERYKKRLMDEKVPSTYQVHVLSREKDRVKVELHASHIQFEGRSADLAILKTK
jgi:PAS domain S-box-containing protein